MNGQTLDHLYNELYDIFCKMNEIVIHTICMSFKGIMLKPVSQGYTLNDPIYKTVCIRKIYSDEEQLVNDCQGLWVGSDYKGIAWWSCSLLIVMVVTWVYMIYSSQNCTPKKSPMQFYCKFILKNKILAITIIIINSYTLLTNKIFIIICEMGSKNQWGQLMSVT